ncbi:hypothetical protein WG902_16325 [Ramlibacter sp. PS3R-8]|uniref:hypothetical protein n=1 Tax=Ramlibacter sp. PS3R-8 TaxID=3133437 RepID=UPI0030A91D0D
MTARSTWLPSHPFEWQFRAPAAGVDAVRQRLLAVLEDCEGFDVDRVRWRLHTAECAEELWLLRDAVFQAVSTQHCQAQAVQRINGLVPFFREVLPARLLTRV